MDRLGADKRSLFKVMKIFSSLANQKVSKTMDWNATLKVSMTDKPEISAFIEVTFWHKEVDYSHGEPFPDFTEKMEHEIEVSENCGNAFTFYNLTQ